MKIILRIFVIMVLAASLSSCFDILHVVRLGDDGRINVMYRLTFAKLESGTGVKDAEDEVPVDEMMSEFDGHPEIEADLKTVESEYASSYVMTFRVPAGSGSKERLPLIPHIDANGMILYPMMIPDTGEEKKTQDLAGDEMAMAMLMGIKYTLLVSKEVLGTAGQVFLIDSQKNETPFIVTDIGDYFLVDIPVGLLVKDPDTRLEFRTGTEKRPLKAAPRPEKPAIPAPPPAARENGGKRGGW